MLAFGLIYLTVNVPLFLFESCCCLMWSKILSGHIAQFPSYCLVLFLQCINSVLGWSCICTKGLRASIKTKRRGKGAVVTFTWFSMCSLGFIAIQFSSFFPGTSGSFESLLREYCVQAKQGHACLLCNSSFLRPLPRTSPGSRLNELSQQRILSNRERCH